MSLPKLPQPLRTLTWAVYLGCSWTWCIGMFLPVILVRDFGNIAWFIFAIPNVVGAAAMGWTLAKPGSSERMVAEHRDACVAFSAITLAFHAFFLYWLSHTPLGALMPVEYAVTSVLIGVVCGVVSRWIESAGLIAGWVALAISLRVMAKGLVHPVFGVSTHLYDPISLPLIGLAVACLFGFSFCPYLDVTFHRARQRTSRGEGKAAFGSGFGLIFLTMIVLTLMYVGDFALDKSATDQFGSFGGQLLITWVAFHIASQAGFTFATHIGAMPKPRPTDLFWWTGAAALAGLAIFANRQETYFAVKQIGLEMLSGQLMYLLFMTFYGLVFPAYVWMFIVPIAGRTVPRSARSLLVWCISMVIAAPMFWVGFINLKMIWLVPGVLVLMGARWAAVLGNKNERRTSNFELRTSK
jgi:hypothetical protein